MIPGAAFEVWAHPDMLRLERELCARLRRLRTTPAEAFDPVLVLVPSRRQMLRVREMLAREMGALLGVDVLTHQALAYRLVEAHPESSAPALASRALRETLVDALLESPGEPGGPRKDPREGSLRAYVAEHPAALGPLTALLGELREAGVTGEELAEASQRRAPDDLAALLRRYEEALDRLAAAPQGWTDRAGLARLAAAAAGAALPRYRAVIQYGAYELIGMNLDLLRALPACESKLFLVPGDVEAPAWRHMLGFFERHLGAMPRALPEDGPARGFVEAARAFRRPEAESPRVAGSLALTFVHTQGPEAELNFAAREALRLINEGVPAAEIGILARTLEPYAATAETVFARHSLAVDSSATLPLSRHPKARAFLLLCRALAQDFERQTMVDLLRSPFLAQGLSEEQLPRWRPDRWDRWSRRFALVCGADAWTEDLPAALRAEAVPDWFEDDPEERQRFEARRADDLASAETLAATVRAWVKERARWRACRTGAEHAAFLRGLGSRWIRRWDEIEPAGPATSRAIRAALRGLLDELESLDALDALSDGGGDAQAMDLAEALAFVESSVQDAELPWPSSDGLRFLDVMQARGLTFRHLFLIGFNADLMPRRPREDLFLRGRRRARARRATGKPLALRHEAREEEWLLFASTLAAATDSLTVVWQRADAEGKARMVSLFLRELERILPGAAIERVPTHPARAAEYLIDRGGLLAREEAALLAADLATRADQGLAGFLRDFDPELSEALAAGIALARAIEGPVGDSGDPALELRYDGFLPDGLGWTRHFSASSLRMLGRCPQSFFFRKVLGVRPLEEAAEEYRFGPRELGSLVHEVLDLVHCDLEEEGRLRGEDAPGELVKRGTALFRRRWKERLAPLRRRMHAHYPVLFDHVEATWREEIEAFLSWDLARLAEGGHRLHGTELHCEAEIPLLRGAPLLLAGKVALEFLKTSREGAPLLPVVGVFDRVTVQAEGAWLVSEYKTAGKIENQVDLGCYLKAHYCQAPLYMLLAEAGLARAATQGARRGGAGDGAEGGVEMLAVGPTFLAADGARPENPVALDAEDFETARAGFEETLGILAVHARQGRFPFSGGGQCDYCEFPSACRRHHYASVERVTGHPEYALYFATQGKTRTRSTLDAVREAKA